MKDQSPRIDWVGFIWRLVRLTAPWYVAVAVLGASGSYTLAASVLALAALLDSPMGRSGPEAGEQWPGPVRNKRGRAPEFGAELYDKL